MSAPNLADLLSARRTRNSTPRGLAQEVVDARLAEIKVRTNRAQNMATTALRRLHADDYRALIDQAAAKINAERGPLPGDEVAS